MENISKDMVKAFVEKVEKIPNFKTVLPDEYHYKDLSLCVIDAVYSIGARYKAVQNVIMNFEEYMHSKEISIEAILNLNKTHSYKDLAKNIFKNEQLTSSRNGILKAEACLQVMRVLKKHDINNKNDFLNKMSKSIDDEICNVKGQGSGIMLKHLYMLAGDDNKVKPDRHIRKFVEQVTNKNLTDEEIQELFEKAKEVLKNRNNFMTVKLLDYNIWDYQRKTK